jgi:hypothetical protein
VAAAVESCIPAAFGPTATQSSEVEHAIELSDCDPPLTVPICQLDPESLVVRIPAPTAMHVVGVVQETEPTPSDPLGIEASDHVSPPSADTRTSPA